MLAGPLLLVATATMAADRPEVVKKAVAAAEAVVRAEKVLAAIPPAKMDDLSPFVWESGQVGQLPKPLVGIGGRPVFLDYTITEVRKGEVEVRATLVPDTGKAGRVYRLGR
jgi:hypothetical protein